MDVLFKFLGFFNLRVGVILIFWLVFEFFVGLIMIIFLEYCVFGVFLNLFFGGIVCNLVMLWMKLVGFGFIIGWNFLKFDICIGGCVCKFLWLYDEIWVIFVCEIVCSFLENCLFG